MSLFRRHIALALLVIAGAAFAQSVPLDALLRGGRIHYDGGRFDRAKEQFTKALNDYGATADGPSLATIHAWLGLSEAQLRNFGPAAGHFRTALASDSSILKFIQLNEQHTYWSWTALINTARSAYGQASYDTSLTYALLALKVDPSKPGTYALIANSYNALGRYEEMLGTARELLRLQADNAEGLGLVGLYYLQKPDSLWPKEMKQARWDSCAYYYRQSIAVYEKKYGDAVKMLGDSLKLAAPEKRDEVARQLVEKSRSGDQQGLKTYIEKDLGAAKKLQSIAQLASQLFYAANNLNVSSSRAGSAMLRAAAESKESTAVRFRTTAESLFAKALKYDPFDFAAMFNLGIAEYQSQQDSLAEATFQRVVDGAVVALTELPADWQAKLLALVTADKAPAGNLSLSDSLLLPVDSILAAKGRFAGGYRWLYFPQVRDRKTYSPLVPEDAAGIFLSLESPQALENIYLLLGVTQTGQGIALGEAKKRDAAKAKFEAGVKSLSSVIAMNPKNAEAWQNLGHCYRETDQKDKAEAAYKKYLDLTKQP